MTRPFDWQSRMAEMLKSCMRTEFVWGEHDCALFACNVAQSVCGIDFADPLRGRYSTKHEAYKVLKNYAGGGLTEAVEKIAATYNCAEVPILMARRGDIVLGKVEVVEGFGISVGICLGEKIAFAASIGFLQKPIDLDYRAWRTP